MDNIHGSDGLPFGVFGVGDSIPDDVLKEDLEYFAGLPTEEPRDPLHSSCPRQMMNSGLGDALDVVPPHLAQSACLAESLSSHSCC